MASGEGRTNDRPRRRHRHRAHRCRRAVRREDGEAEVSLVRERLRGQRCSIEGCEKLINNSRVWCQMHYSRWLRHGDPTVALKKRGGIAERIWSKVRKTEGCWEWTASKNPGGYGHFTVNGKTRNAHRAVYELLVGLVPFGLTLDHLCRNRACVNPDHLEPVTQLINTRRGRASEVTRARHAARRAAAT